MAGVEHHQIDHRRARRDHHVAQPVGDLAVGKLQQHVERAVELACRRRTARTKRQVAIARSMRRPSSRKRQPASWLMFSCARPENDGDDAQRRVDALEDRALGRPLLERRVDQLDQIGRARARRRARSGRGSPTPPSAPRRPVAAARRQGRGCCSAAGGHEHRLRVGQASVGTASQAPSRPAMSRDHRVAASVELSAGAVDQRAHQPQRRLGALHVARRPRTGWRRPGSAARPVARVDGDAVRRGQQRGLAPPACPTSTQASAVRPPCCRLTARASRSSAMRTKPPGITRQPSRGARQEQPQR